MKKKRLPVEVFITVPLVVFTFVYIVPLLSGLWLSFTDWNGYSKTYECIGFRNYIKVFSDERLPNVLLNTLRYALTIMLLTIILGYISALVLKRLRHARDVVHVVLFFPYIVMPVVVAMMWDQIFYRLIPAIGDLLGIEALQTNLLSNPNTAIYAVALISVWILTPLAMTLIYSALCCIPNNIIEAAKLDRAGRLRAFGRITLPYSAQTLCVLVLMFTKETLTSIDAIMTLTSGGPGRATETFYYLVYRNSALSHEYAYGLAAGFLIAALMALVFFTVSRLAGKLGSDVETY